ncbi:hypothetical protein Cni_G06503 [Canna indica]|uniref:Uncharacterized protein n=1 Tax=Canna indica TaxID=4628 RepID=A0AAQ3Q5Z9_9LILI|nr:hypothetical protein Cni_G06503 [Canna indica]
MRRLQMSLGLPLVKIIKSSMNSKFVHSLLVPTSTLEIRFASFATLVSLEKISTTSMKSSDVPVLNSLLSCLLGFASAQEHEGQEEENDPALVANLTAERHFRQHLHIM